MIRRTTTSVLLVATLAAFATVLPAEGATTTHSTRHRQKHSTRVTSGAVATTGTAETTAAPKTKTTTKKQAGTTKKSSTTKKSGKKSTTAAKQKPSTKPR